MCVYCPLDAAYRSFTTHFVSQQTCRADRKFLEMEETGKDFDRWLCFEACLCVNEVSSSSHSQINGLMETWIFDLASALKVRLGRVNVFISDWRSLARQPYPIAAKNSRQVGQDVATLLKWLEVMKIFNVNVW